MQSLPSNNLLKIIPLGGLGHIGGNLLVYETANDLLIVDCGVLFPNATQPGIDYIIPNIDYVAKRRHKLRAYVITHGHEDHIGALPFIWQTLPASIYASKFTRLLLTNKFREYPNLEIDLLPMDDGQRFVIGDFDIEPIAVTHSIPDAQALALRTPAGIIIHTGDFRLEAHPYDGRCTDSTSLNRYGDLGVTLLLSDSTNAMVSGRTDSERIIEQNLAKQIAHAPGRLIMTTFASHIERIQSACTHAVANGRRICFAGRSMQQNSRLACQYGYLKIPTAALIDVRDAAQLPADQLMLIASGSQGEAQSAMWRLVNGKLFGIAVEPQDRVILSCRRIPGNERAIAFIVGSLLRLGAEVIDDQAAQIHTSGHACNDEQAQMINWCRPQFFVPIHGELSHLHAHAALAKAQGVPHVRVIEDGQPLLLREEHGQMQLINQEKITSGLVMVDGSGIGQVDESLLTERLLLSNNGVVLLTVVLDLQRQMQSLPLVQSRGVIDRSLHKAWFGEIQHWVAAAMTNYQPSAAKLANHNDADAQQIGFLRKCVARFFRERLSRTPEIIVTIVHLPPTKAD